MALPVSVNLHRIANTLLTTNCRVVCMGDSFMASHLTARLFYGLILKLPLQRPISSMYFGWINGPSQIVRASDHLSGDGARRDVGGSDWEIRAGSGSDYALPVNQISEWQSAANNTLTDDKICDLRLELAQITDGDNDGFSGPANKVRVRIVYHSTDNRANLPVRIEQWEHATASEGTKLSNATLRANSRPMFYDGGDPDGAGVASVHDHLNAIAVSEEVVITNNASTAPMLVLRQSASNFQSAGLTFPFAGAVFSDVQADGTTLVPGQYWCSLASASFGQAGFGDDTPSTGGKNFSTEQMARWLDITTLDRGQRVVFVVNLAGENNSRATVAANARNIRQKCKDACEQAGIVPPPLVLFIGNYAHLIGAQSVADSKADIVAETLAFAEVAEQMPDVGAFSLYAATDGTMFTTDANGGAGAQAASRAWLDDHGHSTVTYGSTTVDLSGAGGLNGNLLDAGALHMGDIGTAAFCGQLLGDELEAALQAGLRARGKTDPRSRRIAREAGSIG